MEIWRPLAVLMEGTGCHGGSEILTGMKERPLSGLRWSHSQRGVLPRCSARCNARNPWQPSGSKEREVDRGEETYSTRDST